MKDLFSIKGKTAFITGGSRGIGEMIAAGFLANGARVYISSRKAEVCDETARRLAEAYGGECISIPGDLSNITGVGRTVGNAMRFLRNRIRVNSGGVLEVYEENDTTIAWTATLTSTSSANWLIQSNPA